MKLCHLVLPAVLLAVAGTHVAVAGTRAVYPVTLSATGFEGSLGSARNTADGSMQLACEINASTGSRWAYCWGRDAAWNTRGCYVYDAGMLANAQALSSDDYLRVTFNTSGICTFLGIMKGSQLEPKQ